MLRRPARLPAVLIAARSAGYTLTELVVGCAVGLLVAGGMATMYAHLAAGAGRALLEAQLQRSLSAAAGAMGSDLRRAGYWSRARAAASGVENGYAPIRVVEDGACVLYSYDEAAAGADGRPRAGDQHGLRLRAGAVQARTSAAGCGAATCTSCEGGVWWNVTDPQAVTVTDLAFALEERAHAAGAREVVVRNVSFTLTGALAGDGAIRHTVAMQVNVRNDAIR